MKLPPAAHTPALVGNSVSAELIADVYGFVSSSLLFHQFTFHPCAPRGRAKRLLPPRPHVVPSPRRTATSPRRATHGGQHLHLPAGLQCIRAERAGSQIPEGAVPASARGACERPGTCAGLAPPSRHNPSHPAIAAGPVLRTQRHDVPVEVYALCLPPRARVRQCLETARKPEARVHVVRVDRLALRG